MFHQAYIPRRLEEVEDHERDFDRLAHGAGAAEGIYYQTLAGMRSDMTGAAPEPAIVRAANRAAAAGLPAGGVGSEEDARSASAHERPECSSAAAGGGAEAGPGPGPKPAGQPHDRAGVTDGLGGSDSEGSSEAGSGSGSEGSDGSGDGRAARGAPADPEAARAERKAHKAAVKEANRERRKHKLPKHVKKHALAKHKKK